jgi:two-component system sensor histidine kinase BaeS
MKSIRSKFTLAFILVGLTGTLLVVIVLSLAVRLAFQNYITNQYEQIVSQNVLGYFQDNGDSWNGIAGQLPDLIRLRSTDLSNLLGLPDGSIPYTLVGADQRVILSNAGAQVGQLVDSDQLAQAIPLTIEGKPVGWLFLTFFGIKPVLNSAGEAFIHSFQRTILISALGAALFATLMGLILPYTMTRTLRELTEATEEIAQGKLGRKVKIRSRDELGTLAASFNKMSGDVAQANEVRRRMTADIAHDLRTPLSVISGYAETLADRTLDPSPEVFSAIYEETRHLNRLVEDLRTLSLADAGELALYFEPVDLNDFLRRTAGRHAFNAEQRGVQILVDAPIEMPPVSMDPERFSQVLDNLITNALRYTPRGGEIRLGARRAGAQVELSVRDTGSGIAPEDIPYVFNRLYRGDQARQENGESGLGLAIVKSLVEAHGGTIRVESPPGQGATFTINLPV